MKTKKYTIVFGITSGIAAFKVVDLVHDLRKKGHTVFVIMTDHARQMISEDEFVKASRNPVYWQLFPDNFSYRQVIEEKQVQHIQMADSANIIVLAPATANIIGKLAAGIADDYLTTTVLATRAPILLCPSMNVHMWENAVVQENLGKLAKRGVFILHPDEGDLACGYKGVGRLAAIPKIENEMFRILKRKEILKGKKILITAGGTSEPIDAVRIITNRASGKMGREIARECAFLGAEVLLLRAKTAVEAPPDVICKEFETAASLEASLRRHVKNFHVIFHTAAVSDFTPADPVDDKIGSKKNFALRLRPVPKVINSVKIWNPKIISVGFKAVYKLREDELLKKGIEKLKESNADFIVVNDVGKEGIGFGADDNEVYIVSKKGSVKKITRSPKSEIARKILKYIFQLT